MFIAPQFRALSDQLCHAPDRHKFVRQQVVDQVCCLVDIFCANFPAIIVEF